MTDEAAHAGPAGDGQERADTDGETGVDAVSLPAGEARRRGPSPFAGREAISPGAMALAAVPPSQAGSNRRLCFWL